MSNQSYGSQMADIAADEAMEEVYGDPREWEAGDRIPYRDEEDGTDDRVWLDATELLSRRGLRLEDDGGGYVVTT